MTLEEIRSKLLKDGITGYRIGKDTPINQVTADNFLKGSSKPYKSTLEIYETYINNNYKPLIEKEIVPISDKVSEAEHEYYAEKLAKEIAKNTHQLIFEDDIEMIRYISDNRKRFLKLEHFQSLLRDVNKDIKIEDLEKKVAMLEKKVLRKKETNN